MPYNVLATMPPFQTFEARALVKIGNCGGVEKYVLSHLSYHTPQARSRCNHNSVRPSTTRKNCRGVKYVVSHLLYHTLRPDHGVIIILCDPPPPEHTRKLSDLSQRMFTRCVAASVPRAYLSTSTIHTLLNTTRVS